ncbi:MAG: putative manganese transporter [Bacteroidetes bacterium]|nr:putative manganese transporter [Bacteroidota bacterium]
MPPVETLEIIREILTHSVMITVFVIVMMMVIEYLTVRSRGKWGNALNKKGWLQILVAALLGVMPGCLGTFAAVSLYTHRLIGFAALVTVMIATVGDEAFVMFSMIPDKALLITLLLLGIALVSGTVILLIMKNRSFMVLKHNHLTYHDDHPECVTSNWAEIKGQFRNISFSRALMLGGAILVLIFMILGEIGPEGWDWERITFLIVTVIGLLIIVTVPDHFLVEHLWKHTLKKHVLRVLLWTLGAFSIIHIGLEYLPENFAADNQILILLIAVAIGIIPESGPHIVFITLFAEGMIPLSALLANSVVQDGHGAIPLLAESRKNFLLVKSVNLLIGLIVGFAGYFFGF